jgi:hypothetical protein
VNTIPSIHSIRAALEHVEGAIKFEPDPELTADGSDPGTPIQFFDPEQSMSLSSSKAPRESWTVGLIDYETAEVAAQPTVIFEIPPSLTDADIEYALGDGPGELFRRAQLEGIDALGWYVTFHQRAVQYGVHLPIEGLFALAAGALRGLTLPFERKLEIAYHAVLRHELFHFEADCMAANWELSLGKPVYWRVPDVQRELEGGNEHYRDLEEGLANAYMLRGFRNPDKLLRIGRGTYRALKAFCERQPAGYRDGPRYAKSRTAYVDGCRQLSANFQYAAVLYESVWQVPEGALDTLIFYPRPFLIDWRRCPILIHDQGGILRGLGIGLAFFEAISGIFESPSFLKTLSRLDHRIQILWRKRKTDLARSVNLNSLGLQRWKPGGEGCYAVRADGNYRAHLRYDRAACSWIAEDIGDHKRMGHG